MKLRFEVEVWNECLTCTAHDGAHDVRDNAQNGSRERDSGFAVAVFFIRAIQKITDERHHETNQADAENAPIELRGGFFNGRALRRICLCGRFGDFWLGHFRPRKWRVAFATRLQLFGIAFTAMRALAELNCYCHLILFLILNKFA